jgi:hypothetical protein
MSCTCMCQDGCCLQAVGCGTVAACRGRDQGRLCMSCGPAAGVHAQRGAHCTPNRKTEFAHALWCVLDLPNTPTDLPAIICLMVAHSLQLVLVRLHSLALVCGSQLKLKGGVRTMALVRLRYCALWPLRCQGFYTPNCQILWQGCLWVTMPHADLCFTGSLPDRHSKLFFSG